MVAGDHGDPDEVTVTSDRVNQDHGLGGGGLELEIDIPALLKLPIKKKTFNMRTKVSKRFALSTNLRGREFDVGVVASKVDHVVE